MDTDEIRAEGGLQTDAGVNLLCVSRLVRWDLQTSRFTAADRERFEDENSLIHPKYGRLICWIIFSAGAEFLAKGVCMARSIDVRTEDAKLQYPTQSMSAWLADVAAGAAAKEQVPNFGTIGRLTNVHLPNLCNVVSATPEQTSTIVGAYKVLGERIRNRDAHAYVANVRDAHFGLIETLLVPAINLLLDWLPDGPPAPTLPPP